MRRGVGCSRHLLRRLHYDRYEHVEEDEEHDDVERPEIYNRRVGRQRIPGRREAAPVSWRGRVQTAATHMGAYTSM
jgi:hypothetical protein